MLRVTMSSSAAGAKAYYTQALSREDYYTEGQELIGRWGGRAAERLGLKGDVTKEAFERLCDGRHPVSGGKLTARLKDKRTVGYDLNFHAPKSLSAVYALTRDKRILEAFRAAVSDTMAEIEGEMKARVRKGGKDEDRPTRNLVYGEFVHFHARPVGGVPDPHLHAHCFTFNVTHDEQERAWKAGQFRDVKRDAPYFEAAFHARLSKRLAEHGYGISRTAKGWELSGVPESVVAKFSRRTAQIEALAEARGITDAEDKAALGATTRNRKQKNLTNEQLRQFWDARLTPEERAAIHGAAGGGNGSAPVSAGKALDYAERHCFERESAVEERCLLAAALKAGYGSVTPEAVASEAKRPGFIHRALSGRRMVTTAAVIREEQEMLDFCRAGRGTCKALGKPGYRIRRDFLSDEQQAAVLKVLGSSDRVMTIRGAAGTGKTTVLQEIAEGIEANGKALFAFAPSASASRGVLRSEGFTEADTVSRMLIDEKLQQRLKGQVILIDEAGQLGTKALGQVLDIAREQQARVILSGDVRQHGAVARGDSLRLLESQAGLVPAEIRTIRRQKPKDYRAAVAAIAKGDIEGGFARLDAMGSVREVGDDERYRLLATDYLRALAEHKSALVVSPTHREGAKVTALVRAELRKAGKLGEEERRFDQLKDLSLTEAEKSVPASFQAGDWVQFHQNAKGFTRGDRAEVIGHDAAGNVLARGGVPLPLHQAGRFQVFQRDELPLAAGDTVRITANGQTKDKKHKLMNGASYAVAGFTPQGDIRLGNGWIVGQEFGHLAHGYCTTSHASQGRTVDRALLAMGSESFPATNRQAFYVAASRAREAVTIYTESKADLRKAVERSGERLSGTELLQQGESAKPSRKERLMERARVVNRTAYQARAYAGRQLDRMRDRAAMIAAQMAARRDRERGMGLER
jgi:conjugative relaxase-like TrwC/TraI family protein